MTFAASCHISALLRAVGNERGRNILIYLSVLFYRCFTILVYFSLFIFHFTPSILLP